jgi:uncharacterized protein (TIGR02145 family)
MLLILLFMITGCPDSEDEEEQLPLPVVMFEADRTNVLEGDTIHFTDRTSYEPTGWLWSFGDGNTSTEQQPAHSYNSPGTYTVTLEATNESGSSSDEKADYINVIETGTFTDNRDGNSYKTVEIGNQVWMAENLKYLPSLNKQPDHSFTDPMYYVYSYNGTDLDAARATERYSIYGVLYNWSALMNGEQSSNTNPSGVQGVCPSDWHVPSDDEWLELINYLGGADIAGGKLKEQGLLHWFDPNTGATNETGFTALPGGGFYAYTETASFPADPPEFLFHGNYSVFWTSSEQNDKVAWYYHLNWNDAEITLSNLANSKGDGFSVRCVKD